MPVCSSADMSVQAMPGQPSRKLHNQLQYHTGVPLAVFAAQCHHLLSPSFELGDLPLAVALAQASSMAVAAAFAIAPAVGQHTASAIACKQPASILLRSEPSPGGCPISCPPWPSAKGHSPHPAGEK